MEKKQVVVVGCYGTMGEIVCRLIKESKDLEIFCGYDKVEKNLPDFVVSDDIEDLKQFMQENYEDDVLPDVIIDFSTPECTMEIIENIAEPYCIPIVVATTGFTEEQLARMRDFTKSMTFPIFLSANMSYAVKKVRDMVKMLAPLLEGDYDIEILEAHHNRKVDAPSGTAILLAETINASLKEPKKLVYGRTGKREKNEIGISSIRGGNIVGEHTIRFIGEYDEIDIHHTAFSRELFGVGALIAARFLINTEIYGIIGMEVLD